ncbi:MAG TPA: carboxypeptidase-like regulatory domain-containing protein [Candidatus Polarisedimenticolaceae bacterium]|nr:carboxypeptidase-like regulatory domain-containing protein [Candidatus Polarisedimenticolaceae bacterium]
MRPASLIAAFRALTAAGYLLAASGAPPSSPPAKAEKAPDKPATPAKPPAVELRGKITGDGGVPLAKAVVLVLPSGTAGLRAKVVRAESAADGGFVAGPLTGDAFRVRVQAKGYAPLTEGPIPGGATITLHLKKGLALSGTVLDRASKKPVDGATIAAWDDDAEGWGDEARRGSSAGKDGRFALADLAGGKATIEAKAPGHAAARTARLLDPKAGAAAPAPVELLLDPAGTLSGRVTDTSNTPVAGAEVTVFWREPGGDRSKAAKTDADGHYAFPAAADLRIRRMTVAAKGFPSQERPGDAPSDDIVDFILEHGGSIAGTLRSGDTSALPAFHVGVHRERGDDDPPSSGRGGASRAADKDVSDPSGAFRLDDLEPGTYTVEIQARGFATIKKTKIEVRAEQVADLGSLKLDSSSTFRGRVVSGNDQTPVPSASIRLSLVDAQPAAGSSSITGTNLWNVSSSPDGTFTQAGLAKGTYDLTAEHASFAPVQLRITFDPGADSPEVLVTMYRGGSIGGTVVDAQLQPVAGVRIMASLGAQADAHVADTGSDGHYLIDGLTPGNYQVTRQPRDGSPASGANVKAAAVTEGQTTTVDFDEGPHIQMSGVVRKGDQPLANTSIYLFAVDNSVPLRAKKAQTDQSGAYQVGLDQAGRYQASVRIDAAGGPGGQNLVMLTVPDQPQVQQDIVFASNAITGHVANPDGGDIKGAIILAMQDAAGAGTANLRQSTTTTAADGTFRLDAVEPGTYRVTARATGFAPAEQYPVTVSDGQPETNIELTMQRGWLMRGRVLDPNGRAVNDATIVVAAPGNAESGFLPSHTDSSGAFRITCPLDGPVSVAAISPRFAPAVKTDIDPPSGTDDGPDVQLKTTVGGSLRIRVVHRGGGPVPGASTAIRPMPLFPGADLVIDRNRPKPTDGDGVALVGNLYPGVYVVAVVGRNDASPAQANVGEGAETEVEIEVP